MTTTEIATVTNANGRSATTHRGTRVILEDGRKTPYGVACSAGSNRKGGSPQFMPTEGAPTCGRCAKMQ